MKPILSVILIFFSVNGAAQGSNGDIVIGKKDSLYSYLLKEKRDIWVHVPGSGGPDIFSKQRYPVVYVLDGDGHFFSVVGMIHQLSTVNGNTICPSMIVVGIPNTDRTRDLTPTHSVSGPFADSNFARTSGGGENFSAFLEKELMPYIDSIYPTAPYRMLIGHSFGGLFAIHTLVHHTNLFNAYLAIDPSMWWDNKKLLKQAASVLNKKKFEGRTLYLGTANTLGDGKDTLKMKKDTSSSSLHIQSIFQFRDELSRHKNNGLRWKFKYYHEDDHSSVPLISEYDALRFIFDFYRFKSGERLIDPAFNADSALTHHYKNLSEKFGYRVTPPEPLINMLGYISLQIKNHDRAFMFFKMNIDNYPGSYNVYDSMGDYYEAIGKKELAIEYFTKVLRMKDNPATKAKLEKIKSGK